MAAIFRVKRLNDGEPLDVLFVASKRRKTDEDSETVPLTTIVKFAATVRDQNQDILENITKKIGKEELQTNYKQHVVNVSDKLRKEMKKSSVASRFKIVNMYRSLDDSQNDNPDPAEITIIDVEDTISSLKQDTEETKGNPQDDKYVYDLYYTTKEKDDFEEETLLAIQSYEESLVYDDYRENNLMESENDDKSEDSNAESNWRNDYPDSDHSDNSILEDDMREAVATLKVDEEESDLSSENDDYYEVDQNDVDCFGKDYAKYKARILKEWTEISDSSSNESDQMENIDD